MTSLAQTLPAAQFAQGSLARRVAAIIAVFPRKVFDAFRHRMMGASTILFEVFIKENDMRML